MAVAALTIAFVRGFSLNFGVYYAVRESLGIAFQWNPIVVFITRSEGEQGGREGTSQPSSRHTTSLLLLVVVISS